MNRSAIEIEAAENARIQFVAERDGKVDALEFARRIVWQYRQALAQRNDAGFRAGYGLAYRRELVISCVALRKIIRSSKRNGASEEEAVERQCPTVEPQQA